MKKLNRLLLIVLLATVALPISAETELQTVALFNDKAMISVNGTKAKIIKVGQTYKGVKLISSNTDQAEVEVDGKREIVTLNSTVVLSKKLGTKLTPQDSIQIWADSTGFFKADGAVNGAPIEFLVDTGASLVVLSSRDANSIGLEYQNGTRGFASTASGTAPMYGISIDRLNFKGIELRNVEAGVIEGSFPIVPLLGMTFLQRLDMKRSGNLMELKKRY